MAVTAAATALATAAGGTAIRTTTDDFEFQFVLLPSGLLLQPRTPSPFAKTNFGGRSTPRRFVVVVFIVVVFGIVTVDVLVVVAVFHVEAVFILLGG